MRKLIVVILILILTLPVAWAFVPLTDEEVILYWSTLTQEQQLDEIRKLDNIENAIPSVIIPPLTAILSGRDLYISYQATLDGREGLLINIANELEYSVQMDDVTVKNFVPFNIKPYLIVGGSCLLSGAAITAALIYHYRK